MLADFICYWEMTSFMTLDGVTLFLRFKDDTNTCKRMQHSLSIVGSSSVQWRKVGGQLRISNVFALFFVCKN